MGRAHLSICSLLQAAASPSPPGAMYAAPWWPCVGTAAVLVLPIARLILVSEKKLVARRTKTDHERRREALAAFPATEADRTLQFLFFAALIVPQLVVAQYQAAPSVAEQLSALVQLSWAQLTDGVVSPSLQLAASLLFLERLSYTWAWAFSPHFLRFCATPLGRALGRRPLDVVVTLFYLNKLTQFATFIGWYVLAVGADSVSVGAWLAAITPFQWVCLVQGVVLGQGLNALIYKAIGKKGVYYGHRLGEKVPWCTGAPFSVVPHPQYVGTGLSVLGINLWAATTPHVHAGWLNLTAVQLLYYAYMAAVEDFC